MTTRRASLPELSAYRERRRNPFPWHTVNWQAVGVGAGLGSMIVLIVFLALLGWAT
jgi:hypothetical protein